jgi:DNA-binding MarR family transcriptional regulator
MQSPIPGVVIIMTRPFEGILGNTCELRLLEFLLPLDDMEFNVTELSEEAGVSRVTAGRVVKKFVEWGILNANDRRTTGYSLNRSSTIVMSLDNMNNALIGRMLGEEEAGEIREHLREHGRKRPLPGSDDSDRHGLIREMMPDRRKHGK